MICQRCGYCCIAYDVIVVKPEMVDSVTSIDSLLPKDLMHKPSGHRCPHLSFEDGNANCQIHDKDWYRETPCYEYTQVESSTEDPCRMGAFISKEDKYAFREAPIAPSE